MLLLCTVVMLAVSAATYASPPTYPCCTPKRWESDIIDLHQKAETNFNAITAFDEDEMVLGLYRTPLGSREPYLQLFTDFKTMKTYIVDIKSNTCTVKDNTIPFYGSCHAKVQTTLTNLKYLGEGNVGPATNRLSFDMWSYTYSGFDVTVSLLKNGCYPFIENIDTNPSFPGDAMLLRLMYDEFNTTVAHPELLKKPQICVDMAL